MMSGAKLKELSDSMKAEYDNKEMLASDVVGILLTLKMANQISGPALRTISEEIITDEKELQDALLFSIAFATDKGNKKVLDDLLKQAKLYGEADV